MPIPYGKQYIDDEDVAAVTAQLRDDWLTQGPTVGRFEEALAGITGAKYAVAVSSGTAALHLACLAAGVRSGDVGITTTNTFLASANCIRYCNGRPWIVDVEPETGLMSLPALEQALARAREEGIRPKVVIPVDFSGGPPALCAIQRLAHDAGAIVIEAAAHSLGGTYTVDGATYRAASCAHATMAILSFHPVKHLTTVEGGAITTNDEKLYRQLLDLRTHGITKDPARLTRNDGPWYQEQQTLGYNYRLTDVQCALGLSQAKKLPRFLERRRAIAAMYDRAFEKSPFEGRIAPLRARAGVTSAYHLYVVRFLPREDGLAGVAERRKAAFLALREGGIFPQVHYVPIHLHPDYAPFVEGQSFPGADAYYASCISLPMFPALDDAGVQKVIDAMARIVDR